jgi:hypothetical protein
MEHPQIICVKEETLALSLQFATLKVLTSLRYGVTISPVLSLYTLTYLGVKSLFLDKGSQ